MKIVALNGSPRKDGNTAKVLKEMTKEHAGVDLEYFDLCDLDIKDCKGCFYCKKHDTCVIKDDMQMLYQKIKAADALVIGSPLYFGAETAPTKAFLDRMYAMLDFGQAPVKYVSKLHGQKKAICVFTCGNHSGKEVYANVNDRMYSAYAVLGFSEVRSYILGGTTVIGNVMELVDTGKALEECHKLLGDL
jgi:multimeric flavodoxin WrbA